MRCAEGKAHLPVGARMNCKFITCNGCIPLNTTSLEVTQLCLVEQAHQHTTCVQHLEHLQDPVRATCVCDVLDAATLLFHAKNFDINSPPSLDNHHPLWTTHNSPALTTHNPPLCSADASTSARTVSSTIVHTDCAVHQTLRHHTLWNLWLDGA
jgi:hypothetical protein